MDINITPALQIDEKKNLSAEEFQKQLSSWLESKGLLCELRAYFRSNMIEVLKNTALGSSISCKGKQTISPKMQAMNLLISEYFIYSQYHFSLCVFCTEVSLNNMFSSIGDTAAQVNKREKIFKFSEKEVYDILEAIGILRYNKLAQKIYASYAELDEPLISYFVPSSAFTTIILNEPIEYFDNTSDGDDIILENINKIISNSNMTPNETSQLKYYIRLLCEKENQKENKVIENLKEQHKSQLKKYKIKLNNIQESFDNEKRKFQDEINLMKQELNDVVVQNQFMKKNSDYIQVAKVISLNEKLQQTEVMTEQKSTTTNIEVQNKSTQYMEEKPNQTFKIDKEQQTLANNSFETSVLKHVIQQLEKENGSLRNDNYKYCGQIDDLANRASILMNELTISQQNVRRLNNLLQNTPSTLTPENVTGRQQILHYNGAGEECLGAVKKTTPSVYRNLSKDRKLTSKKSIPSSGSTSGSASPTDELLQEAKKRLKNLELESEDIDRKIRSLTERYNFELNTSKNKNVQSTGRPFKFNSEPRTLAERVFEFGACSVSRKDSNTTTENTSYPSQTSFASASTSFTQFDESDANQED